MITTYGTLRRDIQKLKDLSFDYAILDEAQAIKNATAQSAKACRLLQADHRLVMTGTPIENRLTDLWSLFDFLNPGMLGASTALNRISKKTADESDRAHQLNALGQGLRPFILRRTKEQVLTELPKKTEQSLYCEMTPAQKKQYSQVLKYYQAHLKNKVQQVGMKRAKIHVLEALLRLRQIACDPRLVDEESKPGAKVDVLCDQLEELQTGRHKALVFSQFTSLLALIRKEFERRKWQYAYLDGKTRKRAEQIKRFQEDPECPLFLISLKAGGHGLNLTAAEYVFVLDPWWNPAVEAQAIDRAHRMGQQNPVFAYRLISRDTVEEKILQMQKKKRKLADAIITADESLISSLTADDLKMLLEM